ncbi:uncharacterized protein LOC134671063 [Cydia fagiglandana]|uniref:uncharacterized protein LOC134671063 n=1 Tax=Cydia fagiglandana TaxID=1458189 RepID=UPI002FEE3153
MNCFCVSLVLLSAVMYTNAAVALYKAQEKPAQFANQEGCYLEHLNKVIPYGDYYPENSCYKYTCDTDNITQTFSCGLVEVDKRCALVSNEKAAYPDCCPIEICGTISPEYLTEEEIVTKPVLEESSAKGTKSPEEFSGEGIKSRKEYSTEGTESLEESNGEGAKSLEESSDEGRTGPPVIEETSDSVATESSIVKSLDGEEEVNEILIAVENLNLGG